jgi:hypothetical protein
VAVVVTLEATNASLLAAGDAEIRALVPKEHKSNASKIVGERHIVEELLCPTSARLKRFHRPSALRQSFLRETDRSLVSYVHLQRAIAAQWDGV